MARVKIIQRILSRIKPRNDKKTFVGRALNFVRGRVLRRMPANVPKVVVLIMQGSSDDNVLSPARRLKGSGAYIVSVGK